MDFQRAALNRTHLDCHILGSCEAQLAMLGCVTIIITLRWRCWGWLAMPGMRNHHPQHLMMLSKQGLGKEGRAKLSQL